MQGALYTVSVFFYILLIWGHTHPPAYGPGVENSKNQSAQVYLDDIH